MKRISILLIFLFHVVAVLAQQPLTEEILWKFGRLSDPRISPDGKTVIYGVRNTDIKANKSPNTVYAMPATGGEPKVIADATVNAFHTRWRPDGKKIGYLAIKDGEAQLFEMDADGNNKKQVTAIKGGIDLFSYSPKGNYLVYAQEVQVENKVKELYPDLDKTSGRIYDELNYRHWDSWNMGAYNHLFYIAYNDGGVSGEGKDILAGQAYDAPVKPFGGDESVSWNPDGTSFAYVSKKLRGTEYAKSTNSDIYIYNITSGKEENITTSNVGYDVEPTYSPDGQYIAYLSMARAGYEADKNRIMVRNLKTGQVIDALLKVDQTVDAITWAGDSKAIYFISPIKGTKQVFSYTLQLSKKTPSIQQLTNGDHDYNAVTAAVDGKKQVVVAAKMSMMMPNELYSIDPVKKAETQITFVNKDLLESVTWGRVEKRMVTATDGKEILTWVIYPPNFDDTKRYPAILYAQGGPQSVVSQFFSTRWNFQLMAAKGYIVVAPNRRGLPSFGQEWNDAIIGDYGGQPMKDLLSAIDNVSKEKFVDKNKLGAVGASFGGYSVYWLAGNHNGRFKAFISHCGMFNMESWYGSTEEMFFANNDQKGSYWDNPVPYDKFSPHHFVKNWNTPMLVIHNEKDFRVPLTQGLEAFNAAQMKGIPSRFLYFPDENHWVSKPQNSMLWHRVFFDWLDKYVKQ
ncbi:MAG: prolyl oligopeptidase family serine peptidase [Bacteroidia bacterium]